MITPVTLSDLPDLHALIREFADNQGDECTCDLEQLRRGLFSTPPSAEAILIKHGEKICGYALFYPTFSSYHGNQGVYLEDLYLRAQWQKKGLGRAVMQYIAKLAQERGYCRFQWNVKEWNETAISFYRNIGAEQSSGILPFSLKHDALI